MQSQYIVMVRSAQVRGRAKQYGPYKHIAVVELESGFAGEPKMISERARGVRRIVRDSGAIWAGGKTHKSSWWQACDKFHGLAEHLNFLAANAGRRRGKRWLRTLRARIAAENNVEIQQALIERYGGIEAYLADAGAERIRSPIRTGGTG